MVAQHFIYAFEPERFSNFTHVYMIDYFSWANILTAFVDAVNTEEGKTEMKVHRIMGG